MSLYRLVAVIISGTLLTAAKPRSDELVDVHTFLPAVHIDLRYATPDNLAGRALYPEGAKCLLRREVAESLAESLRALQKEMPAWTLLIKDCYRPPAAQRLLYDTLKASHHKGYVTDPKGQRSAVHTFGAAVDVTLCTAQGTELDLGTSYDALGPLAQPRHEDYFLKTHELTQEAFERRRILRRSMLRGRFRPIPNEWWHFDRWRGEALRSRYQPVVVSLTQDPNFAP